VTKKNLEEKTEISTFRNFEIPILIRKRRFFGEANAHVGIELWSSSGTGHRFFEPRALKSVKRAQIDLVLG